MQLTRACTNIAPIESSPSVDFIFYKGTTFRAKLTFKQQDGTPLNITTMSVTFNMVESNGTPELILNSGVLSVNNSTINILNASIGEVEILVTDEETSLLPVDNYSWWITLNPSNGDKLLRGKGFITVMNLY